MQKQSVKPVKINGVVFVSMHFTNYVSKGWTLHMMIMVTVILMFLWKKLYKTT